ncbi:MAG: DoxX family protein [candidate division Zixibacteria bacterium]|nr:DoxX family protein [candidate division Zixibacteria bacterium]
MSINREALAAWGPTVLRIGVGIVFFAYGAQKMWGWFGGPGLSGWLDFADAMGVPKPLAVLAALAEFFGGLGLIFGFLTRFSALGICCVMAVAILKIHLKDGFFMNSILNQNRGHGIEYSLTLLLAATSLVLSGSGRLGLDKLIWRRKLTV